VRNSFRLFLSLTLLFATPLAGIAGDGGDTQLPDFEERARQLYGDQPVLSPPRTPSAHEIQVLASQDEFDVTRYFLDLTFDELSETLDGSVEVTATSLVDGLQTVTLDLQGNMNVTSVTQGIPSLPFVHNGNFLDVTLPAPVDSGQSFTFKVFYNGSPVTSSNYFGWNRYLGSGQGEMVWSLSEPYGARLWWPCKDRPDDKAEVEEWWTINYRWTATGNGVLAGTDSLPGAKTRFRWVATNPLPTYLVSIAASRYSWFSDTYTPIAGGSMPIDYYVYPEDLADAELSFSETPAMIEVYADLFGEYPFVDDKYGMSAFPFGGAMEHSTNTSYGYNLINGSHNYDFIIAHELAHQWWGDSVSPESWPNIWLNEGFASYSEALWSEHLGGATNYHSYMAGLYSSSFSGPLYDPNYLFSSTVYDKGAWVLHMLRGVMGDTAFFQGLRDWYTGHKDGTGNTQQFQATVEALYGASLDYFFQPWVYNANRPRYEYGYTTARCRRAAAAKCARCGMTPAIRISSWTPPSHSSACCSTTTTGSSRAPSPRSRWSTVTATVCRIATTTARWRPTRRRTISTPTSRATRATTTTTVIRSPTKRTAHHSIPRAACRTRWRCSRWRSRAASRRS